MSKPILLITLSRDDIMMTKDEINSIAHHLENEYHILVATNRDITTAKMEVLNVENIDPLTLEQLQERLNLNNILYVDDDNLPEPFKSM